MQMSESKLRLMSYKLKQQKHQLVLHPQAKLGNSHELLRFSHVCSFMSPHLPGRTLEDIPLALRTPHPPVHGEICWLTLHCLGQRIQNAVSRYREALAQQGSQF